MKGFFRTALLVLVSGVFVALFCSMGSAATTEVHVIKYAMDKTTVIGEQTVPYQWMETNLPVMGDAITHYYHQGPVFLDDPDETVEQQLRWNAAEDTNVKEKDMGAVKGTAVRDLCDLVGGMQPGDTVTIKASDGFSKTFAYRNVYTPSARQGEMIVAWYRAGEGYVPEYREGMRLVFLADTSTNPFGLHVFGNYDWHETADPEYWYFYQQGQPPEKYPTTTGLSIQYVSEIRINSAATSATVEPVNTQPVTTTPPAQSGTLLPVILAAGIGAVIAAACCRRNQQ